MSTDHDIWLNQAKKVISPNFDDRPSDTDIDLLVIHCISLPPGQYENNHICDFFQNKLDIKAHSYFKDIETLKVSSHLLIERNGELIQFVALNKRAWHAGVSSFEGKDKCNNYSIGIELEGTDDSAFTLKQYQTLSQLSLDIVKKFPLIHKRRIVGHEEIAPGRKTDPGAFFDWDKYLNSW